MKKSVNSIDQVFKEHFQGAESPVDAESMWSAIEGDLPAKRSGKTFWLALLALLLLLGLAAVMLWQEPSTSQLANQQEAGSAKSTLNTTQAMVEIADQLPQKEILPKSTVAGWIIDNEEGSIEGRQSLNGSQSTHSHSEDENAYRENIQEFQDVGSAYSTLQLLSNGEGAGLTFAERRLKGVHLNPDLDWSKCRDRNSWNLSFLAEIYGFAGYPFISNSLNQDQTIDYSNFLTLWDDGESAVSTFSGGLMLGIQSRMGLSLSAGIEYQQVQNKLNREQTIIERITIYDEMAYYFLDSNNNRVYVADSVTTTRTYTRNIQAAKTHTLINLPVLLGYHRYSGRWRYGVVAGVNIHLMNEYRGKVLDPSGQIVDANTGSNTEVYRTNMNMSFIGGIDLGYMTTDWLELYVSPRFRYQAGSWLRPEHPLQSRMQFAGLQAGLRLHL